MQHFKLSIMNARITLCVLISFLISMSAISQNIPDPEIQIKSAVKAAPEENRDEATVLGYNQDGKLVILKEGSNDMICLADDPERAGFSVSCYHKDLEPFMARGRELRKEGKSFKEVFDTREKEVQSGKLKMPEQPTTLHVLSGPDGKYNKETDEVENANYRYVVYIPYATPESTGLPIKPIVPGGPWLMDPGTHRAHIMISPPQ